MQEGSQIVRLKTNQETDRIQGSGIKCQQLIPNGINIIMQNYQATVKTGNAVYLIAISSSNLRSIPSFGS